MDLDWLIRELEKDKVVRGVSYIGSFGFGYSDKYSDVDLLVLVDNSSNFSKYSKKLLKKYSGDLESHPCQDLLANLKTIEFKIDNQLIDFHIMKVCEYKDILKRKPLDMLAMMVRNIKIIYDPDKLFSRAKKMKYPEEQRNLQLTLVVYPMRIREYVTIAKRRGDLLFLNSIVTQTIENIMKVVYALNDVEFQSPKWALAKSLDFNIKPKNFEKRIKDILKLRNNGRDLNKKVKLLENIGEELLGFIAKKCPESAKQAKEHVEFIRNDI